MTQINLLSVNIELAGNFHNSELNINSLLSIIFFYGLTEKKEKRN